MCGATASTPARPDTRPPLNGASSRRAAEAGRGDAGPPPPSHAVLPLRAEAGTAPARWARRLPARLPAGLPAAAPASTPPSALGFQAAIGRLLLARRRCARVVLH